MAYLSSSLASCCMNLDLNELLCKFPEIVPRPLLALVRVCPERHLCLAPCPCRKVDKRKKKTHHRKHLEELPWTNTTSINTRRKKVVITHMQDKAGNDNDNIQDIADVFAELLNFALSLERHVNV